MGCDTGERGPVRPTQERQMLAAQQLGHSERTYTKKVTSEPPVPEAV